MLSEEMSISVADCQCLKSGNLKIVQEIINNVIERFAVKNYNELNRENIGKQGLMLATTECWGIVDYKDYPLLPWDWVKELCEIGVETAVFTGQWAMIATSNFACPQFVGMWRDVQWHKRLTDIIKSCEIPYERINERLRKTMVYN